jgi:putative PIN family toxin of toxin-antitoxin system
MKIVVDTNVMVSGVFWGGNPFKILEHWIRGNITILVSTPILDEYVRVISSIGYKRPELSKNWIDLISTNTTIVDVRISLALSRDPDDNKFLECAISGNADCIVSGDDDLLVLKKIHGIPIITPKGVLEKFTW